MHWLGLDDPSGGWYLFWSGFGANFGEITLFAGVLTVYRHHCCSMKRCWRIGRHPVEGTGGHARTCHRHATTANHKALHASHSERHPDQHALFDNPKDTP